MGDLILLYGATGYMGRLIASMASKQGLPVVLAGRNKATLAEMSRELKLPYRAFGLETPAARTARVRAKSPQKAGPNQAIDAALSDVKVVLNAAGPFIETAETLARACLRTQTHYTDIGGEHEVFRALEALDYLAQQRQVSMRPGVGLTPLASDLLVGMALTAGHAAGLKAPHVLRVGLSRVPIISRGSAKTMLDSVRDGVLVRNGGELQVTPLGRLVRSCEFGDENDFTRDEPRICTALTLAETFTVNGTATRIWNVLSKRQDFAGVPNIETYVEASGIERFSYELAGSTALALRSRPLKGYLDMALSLWPEGPSEQERRIARQQVFVEVEDRFRSTVRARLSSVNSYDFSAAAALAIAAIMREDAAPTPGVINPARGLKQLGTLLKEISKVQLTFHGLRNAEPLSLDKWANKHGTRYDSI